MLRAEFDEAVPESKGGTLHIGQWRDEARVRAACTPASVLEAVTHLLGPHVEMVRIHGRNPLAGGGAQGLHIDWMRGGPEVHVVTALAFLDDFDRENGATRVVPGTHKSPFVPDRRSGDPAYVDRREVVVSGNAGAIVVLNGHLWHSGTRSRSGRPRRALQYPFQRAESEPSNASKNS